MSCNIAGQVVRGELDNRVRGRITGRIWLVGREAPVELELKGNGGADIRGRLLTFSNSKAKLGEELGIDAVQTGAAGEMTASKKVRLGSAADGSWSNTLFLEWFSEQDGRILVHGFEFRSSISAPEWEVEEDSCQEQEETIVDRLLSLGDASESDRETAEAIERVLRINDLKYEAEQLTGGEIVHSSSGPVPPDVQEKFWQEVVDLEKGPSMTRVEMLALDGVTARPPEELGADELHAELWRLIEALANRRTFLDCTDHLSDVELYSLLVERVLPEPTTMLSPDSSWSCHLSMHEYGASDDEDGVRLYLKYYADDETRQHWMEDFPDDEMPVHQDPPYERDQLLPQGEMDIGEDEGDELF